MAGLLGFRADPPAVSQVLSRQSLMRDVWGYSYAEGTRTVDVHVRRLRKNPRSRLSALLSAPLAGPLREIMAAPVNSPPETWGMHRGDVEAIRQREVGEILEEVLRTGERRALEVEIRQGRSTYALTVLPFPGAEGTPHGAVLTFHDVTAVEARLARTETAAPQAP